MLLADFSARAVSYIRAAKDKFAALTQVATALPTVASDILATTARKGLPTTSSVPEQLLINGVPVPLDNLTYSGLLDVLDSERQLIYDVAASTVGLYNEDAAKIIRNAALTIEGPRSSAASLAVPTKERPLKFVNLASAMSKLATAFAKNSYIEGVIENETEETDPPAKATVHVVTDLNSEKGRQLVRNALKFAVCSPLLVLVKNRLMLTFARLAGKHRRGPRLVRPQPRHRHRRASCLLALDPRRRNGRV